MKGKPETSTDVIARSVPASQRENTSVGVDIRAIDNGFIVRTTHSDNGSYHCKEEFSREKPDIEIGTRQEKARPNPLRSAAKYLNS